MPPRPVEIVGTVVKATAGEAVVWGHAVVVSYDGADYFDLQDDCVDMDSLRDAATAFMRASRTGKRMHTGGAVGEVVHSLPLDAELAEAFGITTKKLGWPIGFLPGSPELAAEFASGVLKGFSIGGWGERIEVDDAGRPMAKSHAFAFGKDAGDAPKAGKRYRLKLSRIDEVSGVDRPAQEWATVALIKSADGTLVRPTIRRVPICKAHKPDGVRKSAWLTTEAAGHSHLLDMEGWDGVKLTSGETDYRSGKPSESGHTHPWIVNADGVVTIGLANGHTHELGTEAADVPTDERDPSDPDDTPTDPRVVAMRAPSPTPTPPTNPEPAAMPMTPEETAQFKRALALAEMTDAQKAHMAKLGPAAADAYLAKSAPEREAVLAADVVVYTVRHGELAGTALRKSADPVLVAMCKSADESRDAVIKAEAAAADSIAKGLALQMIPHLVGTVEVHTAIIKSVSAISDEATRKAAMEALRGADAAVAMLGRPSGVSGALPDDASPARAQLNEMAAQKAARDGTHPAVAKSALLASDPAARALYAQIEREDTAAAARARSHA